MKLATTKHNKTENEEKRVEKNNEKKKKKWNKTDFIS